MTVGDIQYGYNPQDFVPDYSFITQAGGQLADAFKYSGELYDTVKGMKENQVKNNDLYNATKMQLDTLEDDDFRNLGYNKEMAYELIKPDKKMSPQDYFTHLSKTIYTPERLTKVLKEKAKKFGVQNALDLINVGSEERDPRAFERLKLAYPDLFGDSFTGEEFTGDQLKQAAQGMTGEDQAEQRKIIEQEAQKRTTQDQIGAAESAETRREAMGTVAKEFGDVTPITSKYMETIPTEKQQAELEHKANLTDYRKASLALKNAKLFDSRAKFLNQMAEKDYSKIQTMEKRLGDIQKSENWVENEISQVQKTMSQASERLANAWDDDAKSQIKKQIEQDQKRLDSLREKLDKKSQERFEVEQKMLDAEKEAAKSVGAFTSYAQSKMAFPKAVEESAGNVAVPQRSHGYTPQKVNEPAKPKRGEGYNF